MKTVPLPDTFKNTPTSSLSFILLTVSSFHSHSRFCVLAVLPSLLGLGDPSLLFRGDGGE